MKRITRLNIIVFLMRFFLIFLLIGCLFALPFIIAGSSESPTGPIGAGIIILFLIFSFSVSSFTDTISIKSDENHIQINRLLKKQTYSLDEILGFTDSEVEIGRSRTKYKSLVVYTSDGKAYELIKYNYWNFQRIREYMTRFDYWGFEPYRTGFYFRKHKYKGKPKQK